MSLRSLHPAHFLGASLCCAVSVIGATERPESRRTYDLPRGDAADTLRQFATISGRQVFFMMDKVRGEQTNAVTGNFSPGEALDRLLAGTALVALREENSGGFVISRRASPAEPGDVGGNPNRPKTNPMPPTKNAGKVRTWLMAALGSIGAASMPGQTNPAGDSAAKNEVDEKVILSPFTVSTRTNRGYFESESMSGSRVATEVKDLPYALSVVTSEFMKDFGAFEGTTGSFAYTSGVTGLDLSGTGNSVIRGFSSLYGLRDGFFRLGRTDPMLIDRVEFIKGPNVASIYGQTAPGGIINTITRRPTEQAHANAIVTAGSYNTIRAEASASGPLTGNTYYLVAGSDFERNYRVDGPSLRNRSFAFGIEQKNFLGDGNLYLLASTWKGQGHTPLSNTPYNFDSQTNTYTSVALPLATLNQNGPNSLTTREASDATLTISKPLGEIFSFRFAANWWHSKKWQFNAGSGTQYDFRINRLLRGTPAKNLIDEDGGGVQADLVAHLKFAEGKIDSKTLLTFDFSDYYRWDPTWTLNAPYIVSNTPTTVAPGPNGTYWFRYVFPGQVPIDYSTPNWDPAHYTITRYVKNRTPIAGGLLREQLAMFDDRLMLFGTLRYDHVKFKLRSYIGGPTNTGITADDSVEAWSPSLGVSYKLSPKLSMYASYSKGFNAQTQIQNPALTPTITPNQTSWGYDYGFKGSLLDNHLFFTIGGYYTVLDNVAVTTLLSSGVLANTFTGSELGRGFDFDLTWQVNRQLSFVAAYARTNTIFTYFGRDVGAVGYRPRLVPENQGGIAGKYAFTGSLEGLSVNLGVSYSGAAPMENPNVGDFFDSAGNYAGNDGRRFMLTPAYTNVDFNVHYRFGKKWKHRVSVYLKNALDDDHLAYYESVLTAADLRSVYLSYELGF